MDWTNSKDDPSDSLLNQLGRPSAHPPPEFSALVTGLMANGTTPAVSGEWPLPHVARNSRNDFYYQYSIGDAHGFDTDSANRHPQDDDDDNVPIQQFTIADTSEDTSVGIDQSREVSVHKSNDGIPLLSRVDNLPDIPTKNPISQSPKSKDQCKQEQDNSKLLLQKSTLNNPQESFDKTPNTSQNPLPSTKTITKKKTSGKKSSRSNQQPNTVSLSASGSNGNIAPLSHTKMCRDRLNNMFERLRHTLPPAPSGVEVKHKAQLLEYAIVVLKNMVDRSDELEIELAVSSNRATMDWISKLVNRVDTFPEAAEEVMRLFCRRRGWKQAELWIATKRPTDQISDPDKSTILTFCKATTNETIPQGGSLEEFSKESECYSFKSREGVQGRVWSSMRPEWVSGLTDLKNFKRAALAKKYGVKACLAVPVTITGKIEAVMCFYDIKHRPYDTQCLELAQRLAWALGNAIGGKRAKVNFLSTSGTSSTRNDSSQS